MLQHITFCVYFRLLGNRLRKTHVWGCPLTFGHLLWHICGRIVSQEMSNNYNNKSCDEDSRLTTRPSVNKQIIMELAFLIIKPWWLFFFLFSSFLRRSVSKRHLRRRLSSLPEPLSSGSHARPTSPPRLASEPAPALVEKAGRWVLQSWVTFSARLRRGVWVFVSRWQVTIVYIWIKKYSFQIYLVVLPHFSRSQASLQLLFHTSQTNIYRSYGIFSFVLKSWTWLVRRCLIIFYDSSDCKMFRYWFCWVFINN